MAMHGPAQGIEALTCWPARTAGAERMGRGLPSRPLPHPHPGPELTLVFVFSQLTQSTTPAAPWAALSPRLCSSSSWGRDSRARWVLPPSAQLVAVTPLDEIDSW